MKKSTIKLIAMLLTVALMLPNFAGATELSEPTINLDANLDTIVGFALIERQAGAVSAYETIMLSWKNNDGVLEYPEWFGGFYIENGDTLVINITTNSDTVKGSIFDVLENREVVSFHSTDISFEELIQLQKDVESSFPDLDILESGINVENSQVEVIISQNASNARVAMARQNKHLYISEADPEEYYKTMYVPSAVSESENVPTGDCDETRAITKSYLPGSLIYDNRGNKYATLGWYGKYTFSDGTRRSCIVTDGHVAYGLKRDKSPLKLGSDMVFPYGSFATNGIYSRIECGDALTNGYPEGESTGDYAFLATGLSGMVDLTPSNSITLGSANSPAVVNNYYGNGFTDNWESGEFYPVSIKNLLVTKGAGISGIKFGYVRNTSTSFNAPSDPLHPYSGPKVKVEGLFRIENIQGDQYPFSIPGDSGCPIYYSKNADTTLLGFVQGGPSDVTDENGNIIKPDNYCTYATPITILLHEGFEPYPWCNNQ